MVPMNLSPHQSNPVESLFLQSSHNIDEKSMLKSSFNSIQNISEISIPFSNISTNSHNDHLNEHTQKSHYSVESNIENIDYWPQFIPKKAASSHARFEKLKKISAFYEATFSSTTGSSIITLTKSGPIIQNVKSNDLSTNSNSNRSSCSRRKSNQLPISSDVGILSKIEDELGPLQAKLNELSGKVKALNLLGVGCVDFIDTNGSMFDNHHQPTSCKHNSIEFQPYNTNYLEYLHYPECHLHNVASSPCSQQLNIQKINSDFNEGYVNKENKASMLSKHCVNESLTINKPEIIINSVTNNSKELKNHQMCDVSLEVELNTFKNCDENEKTLSKMVTLMDPASQNNQNQICSDKKNINLLPVLLDNELLKFDDSNNNLLSIKSKNLNILDFTTHEIGFDSVSCRYNDRKLPASLFSKSKQSDKICVMIGKQELNFIGGMTSVPEEFY